LGMTVDFPDGVPGACMIPGGTNSTTPMATIPRIQHRKPRGGHEGIADLRRPSAAEQTTPRIPHSFVSRLRAGARLLMLRARGDAERRRETQMRESPASGNRVCGAPSMLERSQSQSVTSQRDFVAGNTPFEMLARRVVIECSRAAQPDFFARLGPAEVAIFSCLGWKRMASLGQ
jgi:hypothetical protein